MKLLILFTQVLILGLTPVDITKSSGTNPDPNIRFADRGRAFVMRTSLARNLNRISLYLDKEMIVSLSGDFSEELLLQIESDWKVKKSYNPYMISSLTKKLTIKQFNGKEVCEIGMNNQKPDFFRINAGMDELEFSVEQLDIIEVTRYLHLIQKYGCDVAGQTPHWMKVVQDTALISALYMHLGTHRKHIRFKASNRWEKIDFPQLFMSEWNGRTWNSSYLTEEYTTQTFLEYLQRHILLRTKS